MRCKEVFCKLRCLRLLSLLEFPASFRALSELWRGAGAGEYGYMQLMHPGSVILLFRDAVICD